MDAVVRAGRGNDVRERVLDPVERVSEMCFGLFMALTFVGAVSITAPSQDAGRTMLAAALGCNLAWGLVDAVMYLVRTIVARAKRQTLALAVRGARDPAQAIAVLRDALPASLKPIVSDVELEAMRARIASMELPDRARFNRRDFTGALGIFLIVVSSTFPVALPFVLMGEASAALLVSRALTLVMLFGGGYLLARYAGHSGWEGGLMLVALGVVLTVAIIALGG